MLHSTIPQNRNPKNRALPFAVIAAVVLIASALVAFWFVSGTEEKPAQDIPVDAPSVHRSSGDLSSGAAPVNKDMMDQQKRRLVLQMLRRAMASTGDLDSGQEQMSGQLDPGQISDMKQYLDSDSEPSASKINGLTPEKLDVLIRQLNKTRETE